jgi:hypothetical protein
VFVRPHHHHLIRARLSELRPTQITVGFLEVSIKQKEWTRLVPKKRLAALENHLFPCVIGPKGQHYVVDHHHLGVALLAEAVREVWLTILDDLSWLSAQTFWRTMEVRGWAHPYDATGRRRDYNDIPTQLQQLEDDPYRSLAGLVRVAGGYAKDSAPYTEFLWADYFRPHVARTLIVNANSKAVKRALELARLPEARYLPGWTGVSTANGDTK